MTAHPSTRVPAAAFTAALLLILHTSQLSALPQATVSGRATGAGGTDTRSLQEMEMEAIRNTLEETDGDTAVAAEILGIDRSTLYRKLKRYGMGLPKARK